MAEGPEEPLPRYSAAAYRILCLSVGTVLRTVYRVTVEGADVVPESGPAILALNHASTLDPAFIPILFRRRVSFLAKAELWDRRRTRLLFELGGQIPLRRADPDQAKSDLGAALCVLRRGGLVAIHPEGTRSPDGRLYRGRMGVARLAAGSGAPVIPVGIAGTHQIWPRGRRMPRLGGRVVVRFGDPIHYEGAADDERALRSFVDHLMGVISSLSGQEYCDVYSSRRDGSGREPDPPRSTRSGPANDP